MAINTHIAIHYGETIKVKSRIIIGVIEGEQIVRLIDNSGNERVYFTANADIDADGSGGKIPGDTYDPDTSLHDPDGKALNSKLVPFAVVPPLILQRTFGIVLGSKCLVRNTRNGMHVMCVVGDIGPHTKIGEISMAAAQAIGVDPNPVTGGESRHIIDYRIYVGKAALINGVQYKLKPYSP